MPLDSLRHHQHEPRDACQNGHGQPPTKTCPHCAPSLATRVDDNAETSDTAAALADTHVRARKPRFHALRHVVRPLGHIRHDHAAVLSQHHPATVRPHPAKTLHIRSHIRRLPHAGGGPCRPCIDKYRQRAPLSFHMRPRHAPLPLFLEPHMAPAAAAAWVGDGTACRGSTWQQSRMQRSLPPYQQACRLGWYNNYKNG